MGSGDPYRLWQNWQQMHYPRRGLPVEDAERARLVTLDGTAGTVLDRYFTRGSRATTLDPATLATLTHCWHELELAVLSADASRYFGRMRRLIEFVLAEVRAAEADQPVARMERMAAKQSP